MADLAKLGEVAATVEQTTGEAEAATQPGDEYIKGLKKVQDARNTKGRLGSRVMQRTAPFSNLARTVKEARNMPEAGVSKLQEGSPERTATDKLRSKQNVIIAVNRFKQSTVRIKLPDGRVVTPGEVVDIDTVEEMERLIKNGVEQKGFIFTTKMVQKIPLEKQEAINQTFGKAFKLYAKGINTFLSKKLSKPNYKKYNKTLNEFNDALIKNNKEGMLQAMKDLETQAKEWPDAVKNNLKDAAPNLEPTTLAKLPVILKAVGFIGFMTVITSLIFSDTGCWAWVDGSKSSKLDIFDFNKNKEYCACSSSNPLVTPEPLDSWCPKNVPEGTPTYVTCAPWNKPVCTVDKNGKGLYYSYYQQSVSGLLNDLIKNGGKLLGGIGEIPSKIAQWILVTGCIFISLYFTYEGVTNKEWIYGVGVLGAIILGILGSILI